MAGSLNNKILRKLSAVVGGNHLSTENDVLLAYSYDASPCVPHLPDAVISPGNTEEVQSIVGLAFEAGVPLVARGAGTGLSGGSLASHGGIIISFQRMNKILTLDLSERVAVVQPGVVNNDLNAAIARHSLLYPPDPGSAKVCTLGGNVSENAGGPHSVKYGSTSDYVLSLECVLPTGAVVRTGALSRRNACGYDLTHLLCGSEGTLGLITEITLKLVPMPKFRQAGVFAFEETSSAGAAISAINAARIPVSALEVIDGLSFEYLEGTSNANETYILFEVDGEPEVVRGQAGQLVDLCMLNGGQLFMSGTGHEEVDQLWGWRRKISGTLCREGMSKIGEDISIPRTRVPEMMERIKELAGEHDIDIAVFGHAGDGVLHPNILIDMNDSEKIKRAGVVSEEIFRLAVEMGGTISGEHGIGLCKAGFTHLAVDAGSLEMMKEIKKVFDPRNIMNPGKIFTE
jgi:glycolate oxidase